MSSDSTRGQKIEASNEESDLHLFSRPVCFVPYRGFRISVYKRHEAQYFYTPVLLLEPSTAIYEYQKRNNKHAISFDILMWNEEVEQTIVDYMQNQLEVSVKRAQVIPFEKAMLTLRPLNEGDVYECPNDWIPYRMQQVERFKMMCAAENEAQVIAEAMKKQAEMFEDMFEMKLTLPLTGMEQIETISFENIPNGEFFSQINRKFLEANEVLLTNEDTDKLLTEARGNVTICSNGYNFKKNNENEEKINSYLKSLMIEGAVTVEEKSGGLWDSVFWYDDNPRPDRTASQLSDVYEKLDGETQKKLREFVERIGSSATFNRLVASLEKLPDFDVSTEKMCRAHLEFIEANRTDSLLCFIKKVMGKALPDSAFLLSLLKLVGLTEKSEKSDVRAKAFVNLLYKVEWNGNKFVPKQITLNRINLAKLRNSQNLENVKIDVCLSSDNMFTMPVNVNLDTETKDRGK